MEKGRSVEWQDVQELPYCLDVHVQNERGREEEVFPIVELSRERARLVSTEDENEVEEGRRDAVPFRKGGGRLSAVAATSPSLLSTTNPTPTTRMMNQYSSSSDLGRMHRRLAFFTLR